MLTEQTDRQTDRLDQGELAGLHLFFFDRRTISPSFTIQPWVPALHVGNP